MPRKERHSASVKIKNRMGFHVRPVKRFAELARVFRAEVEVRVKERSAPGRSVMNLMTLKARHGDTMRIAAHGSDAEQCVAVLKFLAEDNFFVEDELAAGRRPHRHVERLLRMASCFDSEIIVRADGKSANAKEYRSLLSLGLTPSSVPEFEISGEDAEQAKAVLSNLVSQSFYVEKAMLAKARKAH